MEDVVFFPESIFPLGSKMEYTPLWLRQIDSEKHLSLGNLLALTPPVWVYLRPYSMARRMVSNGAYRFFLNAPVEEKEESSLEECREEEDYFFDNPHLWRYIWTDLNHRIASLHLPIQIGEELVDFEEDYSHCTSFVEAYVESIRFEVERKFRQIEVPCRGNLTLTELIQRLFALLLYKLRDSILLEPDEYDLLNEEELRLIRSYRSAEEVCSDIDYFCLYLKKAYLQAIDKRLISPFKKGQHRVETLTFLQRFKKALLENPDPFAPVSLRKVLYPRYWHSPEGSPTHKDFLGRKVPWPLLPVQGITLYEALAYTIWLSDRTGKTVYLPTEAEFERASSWPKALSLPQEGEEVVLDPTQKLLFPWQSHNQKMFHYYFGREGRGMEEFYAKNIEEYEQLLEQTAKKDGSEFLLMLEGFGWHWTCDRYDEDERKYNRFEDSDYPVYRGKSCRLKDGKEPLTVYKYTPNVNMKSSYYILKGSPDIIGGPGITTRRYAIYPLRGYSNVGFRFVVKS